MSERFFTPSGARRALRFVRPATERLCRLYRRMEDSHPLRIVPDELVEPAYFRLLRDLSTTLELLASAGVQVKDPRTGLVDFPARRAGRSVLLCWKLGESTVEHWHELETGFAGRRPIDENGPWEPAGDKGEIPG